MVERAEAHRVRRNRQVRIGAVSAAVLLLVVVTWVFIANRGSSPGTGAVTYPRAATFVTTSRPLVILPKMV